MATNQLKFKHTSDMFGTEIRLQNHNGTYDELVVKSTQPNTNPFKKSNDALDGGFMFHSPDMLPDGWDQTFSALTQFEGEFAIDAKLDKESKKVSSVLRVAEQADAAAIAWGTVNVWEKWSDEKAKEAAEEEKKGPKVFLDKDGNLKARVTVETLDDH